MPSATFFFAAVIVQESEKIKRIEKTHRVMVQYAANDKELKMNECFVNYRM